MVSNLKGSIHLELATTYSIDTAKREVLANTVTQRRVTDKNFGGNGEVTSLIPTVQNISVYGLTSSENSSIANARVSGGTVAETSNVQIVRFDNSTVKGVQ